MTDSLSPPGSSVYASDTMYVGDGTWDSTRNTFLLPNLMGLNFDTMRYNGMGNRFRDMAGYHSMIIAHGVIATIVFLFFVPAAILIVRYYPIRDRYWAYKYHSWLQVLTLLLSTVVFILGWFAVGPRRSLTNPHHGIGLAIYVLVIFQALWGWMSHKVELGKRRYRSPLKLVIHRWLGWATAILGIVQIPLGLTLYGSPKSLFILFSIAGFFWLALFFILSYLYDEGGSGHESGYDSRGSYVSGPSAPPEERRHSGLGRTAAAALAGAGLLKLFHSRSHKHAEEDVQSSYYDDKYSDEERSERRTGWGKRLLEIGAIGGAAALAKSFFDRRRQRESDNESGRYRPAHARSDSLTEETMSRVEEGRPPPPPAPGNQGPYLHPARRQSYSSTDYSYYTHAEDEQGHGVRNAILGAGAIAAVRNLFKRRKDNDEQRRIDEIKRRDMEEERLARANSKRKYTGDGFFPRRQRPSQSVLSSDMTSDITPQPTRRGNRTQEAMVTGGVIDGSSTAPPVPPAHGYGESAAGTELEAAAVGAAAGAVAGEASRRRSSSSRARRRDDRRDDVSSPPVSVKVKMHNDGRHVTLRRLTEEEAAANRESKRRSRERRGSRRRGSASSLSGNEGAGGSDRWRRVEEMERRQTEQVQREQAAARAAESGATAAIPPPPPGPPPAASYAATSQASIPRPPLSGPPPAASYAATSQTSMPHPPPSNLQYPPTASITSPTWTGTEASADYANNRRRRRAERAQARARQQAQHSVEFT
ncbi:hypothetical protein BGW36DRAFT_459795 [Talaromyces proteolyticus]|uniref:Cytochrome b561 domain-containing protein n=1 Tax=Talaromyces proteolyticus TaxID=1131652 RepID=A0AAD4KWA8_9EURO|nr:uncharacterized protein BGW36DRAFT_459795 [Talaromyces proteolyticus]KAH8700653.1 hypothetical protein BGW36DRAFT_459795 [Talaromyces proteolyticus]